MMRIKPDETEKKAQVFRDTRLQKAVDFRHDRRQQGRPEAEQIPGNACGGPHSKER